MTPRVGLCLVVLGGLLVTSLAQARVVPYRSCFAKSATVHNVAEDLLIAVSAVESNWNANARSIANAHGLMQIQWPGTAKHLGVRRVSQLYQPCTNIDLGAKYLRELLDRYGGDERKALAAYNYGPGRIDRAKTLPAGALKYAAKVQSKRPTARAKIQRESQPAVLRSDLPASVVLRTRTRAAAQRYVRALNRRVSGASFRYKRLADGRHGVHMAVREAGLTKADRIVLEALGWRT